MIRAANQTGVMSVENIVRERRIKAAFTKTNAANGEIDTGVLNGEPVDKVVVL